MNPKHKAVRDVLRAIAPNRAINYIKSFGLPEDEEQSLILCDVLGLSYVQACFKLNVSPETLKKLRNKALMKMADGVIHCE